MAGWTPASLPRQLGQTPAVVPPAPGGSTISGPGGSFAPGVQDYPGAPGFKAPAPGVNPGGQMMSSLPAPVAGPGGPSNPAFYGR